MHISPRHFVNLMPTPPSAAHNPVCGSLRGSMSLQSIESTMVSAAASEMPVRRCARPRMPGLSHCILLLILRGLQHRYAQVTSLRLPSAALKRRITGYLRHNVLSASGSHSPSSPPGNEGEALTPRPGRAPPARTGPAHRRPVSPGHPASGDGVSSPPPAPRWRRAVAPAPVAGRPGRRPPARSE